MKEVEIYHDLLEQADSQKEFIKTYQEIVRCLQKYDYNSIFDQEENFRVLFYEVLKMFEHYLSIYPFSHQIIRLDDTILKPLIDQDYVRLVEKISCEEHEKKFYSTRLKAIGFVSEILSGINSISIERMHELMNEYLDQYELEIMYSRQYEELEQNELQMKGYMELSKFYFLVANIFAERNYIDEFERFILMGLEEIINSYDYLLENLQNLDDDEQDQILELLTLYPKKLLSIYLEFQPFINLESQKHFLINFCNQVKLLSDKIQNLSLNQETLHWNLQLAMEFYTLEQYEQAFKILKFIYEERHQIQDNQIMYNLLLYFSNCVQKTDNENYNYIQLLKEITNIELIDQSFLIALLIEQKIKEFDILIENKQFLSLQDSIENIITLYNQYCDFILQNKSDAFFSIYKFIDTIMNIKEIPDQQLHLSSLYQSLRRLKNFRLAVDKQEFEKYFYLIILYIYDCKHQKIEPLDIINQVKQYFSKFECDSKYTEELFQKALTLTSILSLYDYKDLELEMIELMIQKLEKYSLNELLQLFQLKKQKLEMELQRKKK